MDKLTDSEIVKALECFSNGVCGKCDYEDEDLSETILNALDLINRLQAENENLNAEVGKMVAENERLTNNVISLTRSISELTDEVERQRKDKENSFEVAANIIDAEKTVIADAKAEAYKEFAERLKEEIGEALKSNYEARAKKEKEELNKYLDNLFWNYCTGKIHCLRGLDDFLDNLLKELIGE